MIVKGLLVLGLAIVCAHLGSATSGSSEIDHPRLNQGEEIPTKPSFFKNHAIERAYKSINKYLIESGETNYKISIDKAVDWMNSMSSSSKKDDQLLKSLQQFTALKEIDGENKCNSHSYNILLQNDYATGGKAHIKIGLNVTPPMKDRVHEIVHFYGKMHASVCQSAYPKELQRRLGQLDKDLIGRVEDFIGKVRKNSLPKFVQRSSFTHLTKSEKEAEVLREMTYYDFIENLSSMDKARILVEVMQSHQKEDPEVGSLDGEDKKILASLLERYLIKPCQYYVEQLGPDLLQPALYDKQVLIFDQFYAARNSAATQFLTTMDNYRLCSLLISEKKQRDELLNNLARIPELDEENRKQIIDSLMKKH